MNTTTEQVKAMESVREIIQNVNISSENIVSFSSEYVSWTANKVCLVSITICLNWPFIFFKHEILSFSFLWYGKFCITGRIH